jgi:2-polyprenyl-3-methyl-5-hydroxy-6-metoxy-1,4-benzoquinol methylase
MAQARASWWERVRRPSRSQEQEWMDRPGHGPDVLRQNLRDLERCNRWLGGVRLTRRGLERVLAAARVPVGSTVSVVDVGTGGGDIPRALLHWALRRGYDLRLVATDVSPEILVVARSVPCAGRPLRWLAADGVRLPFGDGAFDIAITSLALHHMERWTDAVALLRELRRVSRLGFVMNDIVRGWPGYAGAWLLSRLFSRSALTHHDGPLSVRRAYTVAEMRELAAAAGAPGVEFERYALYRVAMTWRRV